LAIGVFDALMGIAAIRLSWSERASCIETFWRSSELMGSGLIIGLLLSMAAISCLQKRKYLRQDGVLNQ